MSAAFLAPCSLPGRTQASPLIVARRVNVGGNLNRSTRQTRPCVRFEAGVPFTVFGSSEWSNSSSSSSSESSWSSSSSGDNGSVNKIETLEFIIHPDGRVEEKVTGIVGRSCAEVTREIEEKLGNVVHTETTSEYYQEQSLNPNYANVDTKITGDW
eukprot:tig00020610_g12081.t1